MAALVFLGSANGGILSRSSTIAFTFLLHSTAPTPPRAASREGRRSLSVNAMPAMSPWYSPTGPHSAVATFLPYFASSIRYASKLPLPRYGRASSKSSVPSFLKCSTTQSGDAPCSVKPAVSGLLLLSLVRLALENDDPANGPAEIVSGLAGDSGSTVAAPSSSRVL